jgi:hypothetical protein
MQEDLQKNLKESIKHLQIADHITYVTFPLVNDKRLLLKVFEEIYKSIVFSINSMVIFEKLENKGINEDFIADFLNKYGENYNFGNDKINKIFEIMEINRKHRESSMEFVRKDKLVIMSNNLNIQSLNIISIKEYLILAKELVIRVSEKINKI